jgi:hypothetical protein
MLSALLALLAASPTGVRAEELTGFYLKADIGFSKTFLPNLENELERQGTKLDLGYSLGISLGRAFSERRWALEAYFSVVLFPEFIYENEYENFPGDLSHYSFGLALKRNLRSSAESFIPHIGIGIGYGQTNLVSGGGRIGDFEALLLAQLEMPLGDNINLLFETVYVTAFTEKRYEKPFLQNVESDNILDSSGNPLADRYSALELRLGIHVYLKKKERRY